MKETYLNERINILVNTNLVEYDIEHCGLSVAYHLGFIDEVEYKRLEAIPKEERLVLVGKLQLKYPELNASQSKVAREIVNKFINENNLEQYQILSIKKDAIFVINPTITTVDFGIFHFVAKNVYNSYLQLDQMEFLLKDKTLDTKGVQTKKFRPNSMIDEIRKLLLLCENGDNDYIIKELRRYKSNFLNKELDVENYRNLKLGVFQLTNGMSIDDYENEGDLSVLDTSQNLIFLIKIIQIIMSWIFRES